MFNVYPSERSPAIVADRDRHETPCPNLVLRCRWIDRQADLELSLGHVSIAERLSRQAEDLRLTLEGSAQ